MFTAYFDESGSPDETVALVVAGFVASDEQWREFEREWKEVLAAEGVSCFHVKEFAHSRGEFKPWKDDEARRKHFLYRLAGIIRRRVRTSFADAVILQDFREVNAKYLLQEYIGNPYPLCARTCVAKCNRWAQSRGYTDPVRYMFEDGAKHKGEFMKAMKRDQIPPPVFGTKGEYVAFQAADFVAWENLKVHAQVEANTLQSFRDSFEALYSIPNEWGVYTAEDLEGGVSRSRRTT